MACNGSEIGVVLEPQLQVGPYLPQIHLQQADGAFRAIGISSSMPFVAQPALGRTDEELRHEALGYGQALLGLSHACHKQKISLTSELFREEAAKAIDDRAAGVLRDHEA